MQPAFYYFTLSDSTKGDKMQRIAKSLGCRKVEMRDYGMTMMLTSKPELIDRVIASTRAAGIDFTLSCFDCKSRQIGASVNYR